MQQQPKPARGILHPANAVGQTLHRRYLPCAELSEWVEHFWVVEWDFGAFEKQVATLPHPSIHITFDAGSCVVRGLSNGRFTRTLTGSGRVFGIKFLPGAFYPWLKMPVSRISQKTLPLNLIFENADALCEKMLRLKSHDDLVRCAENALLKCKPAPDERLALVRRICESILHNRHIVRVEQVCADEQLSIRQLQRMFSVWVGVSPKWMIQRYRLHEAVEELNTAVAAPDWIGLAEKLGYFDQAHFIRDFKKLTGETPAVYAAKRLQAKATN
ncbi:MAG: AraC family transcriptional regulator [Bacteroidia bacterium]|jgi:AraC-like DNA-binding protein|nr:AraC family transcriptional regulator [Bacteroidia bacterium]